MRKTTNFKNEEVIFVLLFFLVVIYIFTLRPQASDFINLYRSQFTSAETKSIENKSIIIFAATGFFGKDLETFNYIEQCSKEVQSYCAVSSKRQDFEKASAVVFHARDYRDYRNRKIDYYFSHRNLSVPYVIWTFESPMNERNFPRPPHIINWTMSYKLSSDIHFPYGAFKQKNNSDFDAQKIWDMKKTSKTGADIAWMVSNCDTPNNRLEIVKKLQELGLKIDIFGDCGTVPESCSRWAQSEGCETRLISPYKFYIAMENSNCKDYVTEKFWRNMKQRMTVPIVLGKKNYVEAGIIDIMATGDNDYGFCKLCQKLHSGKHLKTKKWYNELIGKWHTTQECDNEVGYRFLNR